MASQAIYCQTYKRFHFFLFRFYSKAAVSYSRDFVTSVVLGKDVVPRIGLHQLESLRHDLVQAIQQSQEPKVINHICSPPPLRNAAHTTKATVKFYPEVWTSVGGTDTLIFGIRNKCIFDNCRKKVWVTYSWQSPETCLARSHLIYPICYIYTFAPWFYR